MFIFVYCLDGVIGRGIGNEWLSRVLGANETVETPSLFFFIHAPPLYNY